MQLRHDWWVGDDPLIKAYPRMTSVENHDTVSTYISEENSWNQQELQHILSEETMNQIKVTAKDYRNRSSIFSDDVTQRSRCGRNYQQNDQFDMMELKRWLKVNCHSNKDWGNGLKWGTLFSTKLWDLWKDRNDKVFNRLATTGGLIRSDEGSWIGGFMTKIGKTSSVRAELWGVRQGLILVKSLGATSRITEMDAKWVVDMLNANQDEDHEDNVILKDCMKPVKEGWVREDEPPSELLPLLDADARGEGKLRILYKWPFLKFWVSDYVPFKHQILNPISLVRDHRAKEILRAHGVTVRSYNADLLYEPWDVTDDNGCPFTTFSAFWEKCLSMPLDPEAPLLPPNRIVSGDVLTCTMDPLVFEDKSEKGSNALLAGAWSTGWSNADKALTTFINGPLLEYSMNRRKADSATTSFLPPHLHFWEVSVRKVFHLVRMKQVLWANKGINLVKRVHERPLLGHLKFFPWAVNEGYFKAWRQGRTGYPLVDAGMRELWVTGWLHDQIRVVVSSFFVKVLQLPWRWGMKYFWDTLLDADLESDALGWQYISSTLPDGCEFDRIDNPQFEGYKFNPNGEYVRRWLPELARLPTDWIHHPWNAPESVLQAAGFDLGSNYPLPIVGIDAAKSRLEEALSQMWQLAAASRAALSRNSGSATAGRYQDQMVPSLSSSLLRGEHEEPPYSLRTSAEESRAEVPRTININREPQRNTLNQGISETVRKENMLPQLNFPMGLRNAEDSTAESSSSSSRIERDGGVVPVWSPPSSSYPEPFIGDENGISVSSSYLQRHPQSHRIVNWRQRLSQTG
ncbi:Cryptochrome-1 [Hibiscus syriacus]|uniref:Cryptochrome-1 n=1 Tax=Hibiscus syriacus TaxID=106335 RepID=A0A6A3AYR6_HIBSY|nr:Cryptochrome-1 [Hibiscus syriacus]